MTKSKIVQENDKIPENLVNGYKKIQEVVVVSYIKIMQPQRQEERQVSNNEEKHICSHDFRNNRRYSVCTWNVHGIDS